MEYSISSIYSRDSSILRGHKEKENALESITTPTINPLVVNYCNNLTFKLIFFFR